MDEEKFIKEISEELLKKINQEKSEFEKVTQEKVDFDDFVTESIIKYWLIPILYKQGFCTPESEKIYSFEKEHKGKGRRKACDIYAKNDDIELWIELKYLLFNTGWTKKELEGDMEKLSKEKGMRVFIVVCENKEKGNAESLVKELGLKIGAETDSYSTYYEIIK